MILHIYRCEDGDFEFVISELQTNIVVKRVNAEFLDELNQQIYDMVTEQIREEVKLFIQARE